MIGGGGQALPDGYVRFQSGRASVVARASLADAVAEAMADDTLYDYARRHPQARSFLGRGVAYAVPLPGNVARVVVRHSRHGGLLAAITGDRFLIPRAPRELAAVTRLRAAGVRTPEVIAFATYPAGGIFSRTDVATREVTPARDLGMLLLAPQPADLRADALAATGELLRQLARAGVRHPDLNVKNVLIEQAAGGKSLAWALDVDTVRFRTPGDPRVAAANAERLARSLTKWRRLYGMPISDAEIAALRSAAAIST